VALVKTDVSEEIIASIMRIKRISKLGKVSSNQQLKVQLLVTANAFPSSLILFTFMMEAILSSEASVLTRAIRCNTPEEGILHINALRGRNIEYIL
jgi:hypothetical protein